MQISLQGVKNAPQDLRDAVSRTLLYLKNDQLEPLIIDRRASSANIIKGAKALQSLTLTLTSTTAREPESVFLLSSQSHNSVCRHENLYRLTL